MITKKDYIAPNIEMTGVELQQMVAASHGNGITGGGDYSDIGWSGEDDGEHEADARFFALWDDEDEDDYNVAYHCASLMDDEW